MTGMRKCRICQSKIHQEKAYYCTGCAYKKGICAMCGKKILSTKSYRQSAT
jgi:cysteine-rich PDZ-binding protein